MQQRTSGYVKCSLFSYHLPYKSSYQYIIAFVYKLTLFPQVERHCYSNTRIGYMFSIRIPYVKEYTGVRQMMQTLASLKSMKILLVNISKTYKLKLHQNQQNPRNFYLDLHGRQY